MDVSMIWVKRRFAFADYAPYQDRLTNLLMANAVLYPQFIMVAVDVPGEPGVSDYYVGVPREQFLTGFDGFQRVTEEQLPTVIDSLCVADASKDEFKRRFRFRHDAT
jgi:hypothetical protein